MPRASIFPIALMIPFTFIGCGDSNTNVNQNPGVPGDNAPFTKESNSDSSPNSRPIQSKIKLKDGDGENAFSVKRREDGFDLLDHAEQTIVNFHLVDNRLKIKTLEGSELGDVTFSNQKFKIQDATKPEQFWNFKMQIDGDWKLEDQNDQLLAKIKKRDYGYEIEDSTGRSLYKSKLKDGQYSLRDSSDTTRYYTRDNATSLAIACIGFDALEPLHIKAALMTMVLELGQQ
jgi:hypothetical protein